jgi:hypothetical protein
MVPVLDANGNPIPLYLLNGNQVPVPAGTAVPAGATPLYQLDSNGNPLPVLNSSGTPVTPAAFIPLYESQIARTGLNPRGRYALHFHRTGIDPTMPPATVDDVAVVDSVGWGIVNHSSYVNVSNSVVFNATGAAYVTEAGDEIGSFVNNIAIHSQGAGGGIEDRKNDNDFGQLGDGFWLQGGDVSLVGNIGTGQRHSGFVFFPVGLNEGALGIRQIPFANLDPKVQAALKDASPTIKKAVDAYNLAIKNGTTATPVLVPDGDVPLLKFENNTSFGDGDGFESWFSLLDFTGSAAMAAIANDPNAQLQTVVKNFNVWNSGGGVFDPYTNSLKFVNTSIVNNLSYPGGTAFNRNDVTANITYDHVNAQGWNVGINVPVNGTNAIIGGTFNNLKSIYITTANDPNRLITINDGGPSDPINFVDNLTSSTTTKSVDPTTKKTVYTTTVSARQQYDIYLQINYDPKMLDITTFFNKDVIKLGVVQFNGQQLYYKEQAADYVPFPTGPAVDPNKAGAIATDQIPAEFLDKTNQYLWDNYGLAIGGILAPATTGVNPPGHFDPNNKINGILGPLASTLTPTYLTSLQLTSAKYTQYNKTTADYTLSYRYWDPTYVNPTTKAVGHWVSVKEPTMRLLHEGWNVLTIQLPTTFDTFHNPNVRTLLVYGDDTPPTFQLNTTASPLVINKADVDNGSIYHVSGTVIDASVGPKHFETSFALNDPTHVFPVYLDPVAKTVDPNHLLLEFTIYDNAKNAYTVIIEVTVTTDATLLRDLGQKNITTVTPSTTLQNVIWVIDALEQPPVIVASSDPNQKKN